MQGFQFRQFFYSTDVRAKPYHKTINYYSNLDKDKQITVGVIPCGYPITYPL